MPNEVTPTYRFLLQQYKKAKHEQQQWLKGSTGYSCGVFALVGSASSLMLLLIGRFNSLEEGFFLIFLFVFGLVCGFLILRKSTIGSVSSTVNVCNQFKQHIRFILLDQGLLAMLLLTNPLSQFPKLAQDMNQLGIPTVKYVFDEKSIQQRFKLLIDHYDLICKHYRLEPFPPGKPRRMISIGSLPEVMLAKIIVTIVLFEAIYIAKEQP